MHAFWYVYLESNVMNMLILFLFLFYFQIQLKLDKIKTFIDFNVVWLCICVHVYRSLEMSRITFLVCDYLKLNQKQHSII